MSHCGFVPVGRCDYWQSGLTHTQDPRRERSRHRDRGAAARLQRPHHHHHGDSAAHTDGAVLTAAEVGPQLVLYINHLYIPNHCYYINTI